MNTYTIRYNTRLQQWEVIESVLEHVFVLKPRFDAYLDALLALSRLIHHDDLEQDKIFT